jgi:hypothetical protein
VTVPMWSPFALLAVVCAVYPTPGLVRRVTLSAAAVAGGLIVGWLIW